MGRGISEIIIMILLLLIVASLISVVYIWSTTHAFEYYPEEEISRQYLRSRACLSLEEINGIAGTAVIRNCGLIPLSNFTLYIDESVVGTAVLPDKLEPNEESAITFPTKTIRCD